MREHNPYRDRLAACVLVSVNNRCLFDKLGIDKLNCFFNRLECIGNECYVNLN